MSAPREIDRLLLADDRIPEVDLWPDCPICGKPLQNDEGWSCDACEVIWNRSGEEGEYIGALPSPSTSEREE